MGKVKHHKHEPKHHESHKDGFFSRLSKKFNDAVVDIIEVPEEEKIKEELVEEKVVESSFEEVAERLNSEASENKNVIDEIEESDEVEVKQKEREEMRERIHDYIMNNLDSAVKKWKETGDVGVHLDAPVPFRERFKSFIGRFKLKRSVRQKLETQAELVSSKVVERVEVAEKSGKKVDTERIVREEWKSVVEKMESVSNPSEREEIEKIYKELSGN